MKIFYKSFLSGWLFLLTSIICYGQQNGIVKTDRATPVGLVSFAESSKLTGIGNSKHVDGYVKKYGSTLFTFPVGHNGVYRPFGAEADGTAGAYFQGDPGTATLPLGAPFSTTNKGQEVMAVSRKELWDIKGAKPTKITLTWNATSDVAALTGSSLPSLSIVGWNATTSRWEKVPSTVDEISLLGTTSSLTSGSITSVQTVIPDTYKAYTLAALNSVSLPVNFSGNFEVASCTEITGWVWDSNYPNSAISVELLEGNNVYSSTTANIYRADLKNTGVGTGNYGFKMALPSSMMGDGKVHQLSIRVRGSNYILNGSPKSLTCAFASSIEKADCNDIQGWVWDKNDPGKAFTVVLIENNTAYASSISNIYREDLKNSGIGTGNYGFKIPIPNTLKDGKPHQITARLNGINYTVQGSPKTLTCAVPQYYGNFDIADCNQIVGWVWDKSYPDMALTVELYEGSTVYGTALANTYRENVKNAGYGTGNYGFVMPMPASLKDGKPHQLSVRVKGANYVLGSSPRAVNCSINQYQGIMTSPDCNQITGWVWDKNFPNSAVTVEVFEGTTVYGTALANLYLENVKNAGYGTGNYGFSIPTPAALKDGLPHQLSVRVKGSSYVLGDSPRALTCAVNQFYGNFDIADCNQIIGWVWDKNFPNAAMTVEIYEGSTVYGTVLANLYRENVKNAGYGTGNYGFNIPMPAALKDGMPHQLSIRVKGASYVLGSSPRTITCAVNQFFGNFDIADCNQIIGWVWDKNFPNAAMTVEIYEGSTVYGTVLANLYRENVKNAGYGTGNYGFNIPMPAALKDGMPHQLSIRVKGSSYLLGSSPRTVTCATNQFQSNFDSPDCNQLTGWVWDKNLPSAAMTVELYEGEIVYGTALANLYRENLKTAGYGTGNYGFSMPMPTALRDGKPHQLSVRVKGSNYILAGSPRAISCAANQFFGNFDIADCNQIIGWVWDKNFPDAAMTVELYEGTTIYSTTLANVYRANVKNAGYGTGNYGFVIPMPSALKDGMPHQLSIRVKGSSYVLGSSPRAITCAINQYQSNFDTPNCSNYISGWVWDKNFPSAAMTVELYEGTTIYGTALANVYRESVKTAGYGTGNYGFNLPIPAALKDGMPHQLSIRVKGTNYNLAGSPRALTCPSASRLSALDNSEGVRSDDSIGEKERISVSPNPTTGKIHVTFYLHYKQSAKLSVVNILGQVVWEQQVTGTGERHEQFVDLSQNTNGIYLVRLQMGEMIEVKRIALVK
jgi:hypothetical protein